MPSGLAAFCTNAWTRPALGPGHFMLWSYDVHSLAWVHPSLHVTMHCCCFTWNSGSQTSELDRRLCFCLLGQLGHGKSKCNCLEVQPVIFTFSGLIQSLHSLSIYLLLPELRPSATLVLSIGHFIWCCAQSRGQVFNDLLDLLQNGLTAVKLNVLCWKYLYFTFWKGIISLTFYIMWIGKIMLKIIQKTRLSYFIYSLFICPPAFRHWNAAWTVSFYINLNVTSH